MRKLPTVLRLMPVLDFGGVESRVALQASMARSQGYELRVCTFAKDGAAAKAVRGEGVRVDVLGESAAIRNPKATFKLIRYLRATKPDLVHSSIVEANTHLCLASLATGIPAIVEEVGQLQHSLRARLVFRALYRIPRRIVAVSAVTKRYLIEQDKAPPNKVQLIYNCAHPKFFPKARATTKRRRDETTRFVAIGRFHPIKNHAPLIRGFAKLVDEGLPVHLRLVGDGPIREELENLVQTLGVGEAISFDGFRSDIAAVMAESDAFVLPSVSEGCSISLIESMASGLPAMGSDVAGIREVLGDSLADTWTFPVSDERRIATTLRRFVETTASDREDIAQAAQERAYSMFSPKVYLGQLESLYGSVLGRTLHR